MRKKAFLPIISIIAVVIMTVPFVSAIKPSNSIVAKDILYSAGRYLEGQVIPTGFDEYGYNYQGHMFSGSYFNAYANGYNLPVWEGDDSAYYQRLVDEEYFVDVATAEATATAGGGIWWAFPYRDVNLVMKWNDAWISNKDQDIDGLLDRYYGYPSYIGSGAWLTNHQSESDETGLLWDYFTKIVAVPADAVSGAGVWYTADGVEIGPEIWGSFATIQSVYNEIGTDIHGVEYLSPNSAGFGAYFP